MEKTAKREMIGTEGKVLLDTLQRLHRKGAVENCIKLVRKTHPADLAWIFPSLSPHAQKDIFQIIANTELVSDFLAELDESIMVDLVDGLSTEFMAEVVTKMASDDAADLLDALPNEIAVEIRTHMETDDRNEVEELLKYHPETAGGLMSPDFMYLDADLTIEEAIRKVQKRSEEKEMVFYLYITRGDGLLAGVLSLREL
ncbi:MAG: CBS domain-containing protein, partial [Desulfobulbaceae bacterium]|nr:CBS domain-containing protein [Desulfobulbaceae bacterium]